MNELSRELLEILQRITPKHGRDGADGADGQPGERGERGPVPGHEWLGSALRLQKADGSWGEPVELKGDAGRNGQDGRDGRDGVDGKDGVPGKPGNRGAAGKAGKTGPRGPMGPMGPMPSHQWDNTRLRFELDTDVWGKWVELRGPPGHGGGGGGGGGGGSGAASDISIEDDGDYYAGDTVEEALHELGERQGARNRVVGGDFGRNPWSTGSSFPLGPGSTYVADGWQGVIGEGTGAGTIFKSSDAPSAVQAGVFSTASLAFIVTTADASAI